MSADDLTLANRDDPQVRARWQSDLDGAMARIPDEWLIYDGDWVGIEAGHCTPTTPTSRRARSRRPSRGARRAAPTATAPASARAAPAAATTATAAERGEAP